MKRWTRVIAGGGLAAGLVLATAGVAAAHVTLDPDTAPQGASDLRITFRVPNESDTASTVKVRVQLPTDHPIASVDVLPVAGWTADVKTTTLTTPIKTDDGTITEAVTEIDWSGGSIKPGEYGEFTILAGKLPDGVDQLVFPTLQDYDNGKESAWIDPPVAEGQPEPESPAPVLTLTDATGTTPTTSSGSTAVTSAPTVDASAQQALSKQIDSVKSDVDSTRTIAIIALVVGAIGLIAAIAALVSRRKPGTPPAA